MLVLCDQLIDELSSLLDISLSLILQLLELLLEYSDVIDALLRVCSRLISKVFHSGEVMSSSLILQLVDGELNLSGSILLLFDKL